MVLSGLKGMQPVTLPMDSSLFADALAKVWPDPTRGQPAHTRWQDVQCEYPRTLAPLCAVAPPLPWCADGAGAAR